MDAPQSGRGGMPLHTKILLGLVIGAAAGVAANALLGNDPGLAWAVDNVAQPIGQIFLRFLFMIVVPLVFASIALGVAALGDLSRVGRIGMKTLAFFLVTTAFAAALGLLLVNTVRPGEGLDPAVRTALLAEFAPQASEKVETAANNGFGVNTFVNIIPRNPIDSAARGDMLAIIFFALVFGIALTRISRAAAEPLIRVLDGINEVVTVIIGFAMRLAPVGVAALIFSVTARFGYEVLQSLGLYVGMVMLGLALHQFAVLPALAKLLAGVGPAALFRKGRAMMVTAFSTSSSSATLPTTLRTAESFGVPREIAGFVVPLGSTMNMNGTALFEGMTVLFLAQVFGVSMSPGSQLLVIVMSVITAIGAAGVPGGSIPLLVLVLEMVGVPGEGIALVLGVDRLLDMSRTVPNVTGDLLTAMVVARTEGVVLNSSDDVPQLDAIPAEDPVIAAAAVAAERQGL